jgi:hypothetical protein
MLVGDRDQRRRGQPAAAHRGIDVRIGLATLSPTSPRRACRELWPYAPAEEQP